MKKVVTFVERLGPRTEFVKMTGVVVGQHEHWLIVRVGEGKHQTRFLVDEKNIKGICTEGTNG